jgi:hypothetical protein
MDYIHANVNHIYCHIHDHSNLHHQVNLTGIDAVFTAYCIVKACSFAVFALNLYGGAELRHLLHRGSPLIYIDLTVHLDIIYNHINTHVNPKFRPVTLPW